MIPHLSLIVPTYNGAHYIAENLRELVKVLDQIERPYEVVVVCDGSTDGTADRAREVDDERVRVVSYPVNAGKGAAIVHGIGAARGRLVGWLDADLDIAPDVIVRAVALFDEEPVDSVIGSKRAPGAVVDYPPVRRLYSAVYQLMVRVLLRVNVRDTQSGAKVFRREALDTVAPLLLIKRYAFDLEVLAVCAEFGFDRVRELPITLHYRFTGTGINPEAIKRMIADTLAIAYRIHLRHWYVRRFASLQRMRMDAALEPVPQPEKVAA